jgi:hypothetical protein
MQGAGGPRMTGTVELRICVCGCGRSLAGLRRLKYYDDECRKKAARAALLMSRFGMTIEEYDAILCAQGGVCYMCRKPPGDKHFPVDHDHKTGIVRGIPCLWCNLDLIGKRTDPGPFRRAAEYLENPPAYAVIGQRFAANRPRTRKKPRRSSSTAAPPRQRRTTSPNSRRRSTSSATPSKRAPVATSPSTPSTKA